MALLMGTYDGLPFYDESYFKPGLFVAEFPALTGEDEITFPQVKPSLCDPAEYGDPIENAKGICFSPTNEAYEGKAVTWGTDIKTAGSISYEWCNNATSQVIC